MTFNAFRKLIEKGFPQKAFFSLILKINRDFFYLGEICLSQGDRLIYFPAIQFRKIKKIFRNELKKYMGKEVDHLTLEKNLKRWHITLTGNKHIQRNFKTKEIKKGILYWFSLNLKSLDALCRLAKNGNTYKITKRFVNIPSTHSEDRTRFLTRALLSGKSIVLIPKYFQNKPIFQPNRFFHFSFFINMQPKRVKTINLINPPIRQGKRKISSAHIIKIKEDLNLIVVCAWLEGELSHKILYNWL